MSVQVVVFKVKILPIELRKIMRTSPHEAGQQGEKSRQIYNVAYVGNATVTMSQSPAFKLFPAGPVGAVIAVRVIRGALQW